MNFILFFVCVLFLGGAAAEGVLAEPDNNRANFAAQLAAAALARTHVAVIYDGSYQKIAYPNGDVPDKRGVCTDVVIRSYRALGVDLQALVHRDMQSNFAAYPSRRLWGLLRPDTNIDHRRVPNLQAFFIRQNAALPISLKPEDYHAGDIVTWLLPGNLPHIGIVSGQINTATSRPFIVHNIGQGPKLDDMLMDYPITGHYRYAPP